MGRCNALQLEISPSIAADALLCTLAHVSLRPHDAPLRVQPPLPAAPAGQLAQLRGGAAAADENDAAALGFELLYVIEQVCAASFCGPATQRQLAAAAAAALRGCSVSTMQNIAEPGGFASPAHRRWAVRTALRDLLVHRDVGRCGAEESAQRLRARAESLLRSCCCGGGDAGGGGADGGGGGSGGAGDDDALLEPPPPPRHLARVRHVAVTPCRVVPHSEETELTNRVPRGLGLPLDRFVRATFADESMSPAFRSSAGAGARTDLGGAYARVEAVLKSGRVAEHMMHRCLTVSCISVDV